MMENKYLVTRDANGKIRFFHIYLENQNEFVSIHRESGVYGGKITPQPTILVAEGKGTRTIEQQALLQYNHLVKEKLDKGYKLLDNSLKEYSLAELDDFLPEVNTDTNGFKKHMLAKSSDKVKQSSIDKVSVWYASRKIDGVRCSFYWDGEKIRSASRGGKDYDLALSHFLENEQLIDFFKEHPDYVLDGELYKHGKSLQKISGAARLEKNAYDCEWLEYYLYDIMLPDITFQDRFHILNKIGQELNLSFNPYREWEEGELQIQLVPHERVHGWDAIMKLHNAYVEEGWEGVVIRDPSKTYGFGKRTNSMIKVKKYKDSEFKTVGYELGLRGNEDMVFICETEEGKQFKAKPLGDRDQKDYYIENFDEEFNGCMATVKYFYMSEDGIPLQPAWICKRDGSDY